MDGTAYIKTIDRLLGQLRVRLLGEDAELSVLLPTRMALSGRQERADYLASRLLFALACRDPFLWEGEMYRTRCWLYEVLLYLYFECDREDWTMDGLLRLASLPVDVRRELAGGRRQYPHFGEDNLPPFRREELEAAMVELLPDKGRTNLEVAIRAALEC